MKLIAARLRTDGQTGIHAKVGGDDRMAERRCFRMRELDTKSVVLFCPTYGASADSSSFVIHHFLCTTENGFVGPAGFGLLGVAGAVSSVHGRRYPTYGAYGRSARLVGNSSRQTARGSCRIRAAMEDDECGRLAGRTTGRLSADRVSDCTRSLGAGCKSALAEGSHVLCRANGDGAGRGIAAAATVQRRALTRDRDACREHSLHSRAGEGESAAHRAVCAAGDWIAG